MTSEAQNRTLECPTDEIAAYIDGELSAAHELELEDHLAGCQICSVELNQQKQFLCGLSSSLKNEGEIELPANFTKLVVANAESSVNGLRRPRERFNAIFICAGLFLFALFALGTGAGNLLAGISSILDQIAAVGGFFGHIIYSFFVGVAIVLRSFAAQFRFDAAMTAVVAGVFAVLLVFISRRVRRMLRV